MAPVDVKNELIMNSLIWNWKIAVLLNSWESGWQNSGINVLKEPWQKEWFVVPIILFMCKWLKQIDKPHLERVNCCKKQSTNWAVESTNCCEWWSHTFFNEATNDFAENFPQFGRFAMALMIFCGFLPRKLWEHERLLVESEWQDVCIIERLCQQFLGRVCTMQTWLCRKSVEWFCTVQIFKNQLNQSKMIKLLSCHFVELCHCFLLKVSKWLSVEETMKHCWNKWMAEWVATKFLVESNKEQTVKLSVEMRQDSINWWMSWLTTCFLCEAQVMPSARGWPPL